MFYFGSVWFNLVSFHCLVTYKRSRIILFQSHIADVKCGIMSPIFGIIMGLKSFDGIGPKVRVIA